MVKKVVENEIVKLTFNLDIPYDLKDTIKKDGLVWVKERKFWLSKSYTYDEVKDLPWIPFIIVYLNAKYDNKDFVKEHGAKWDPDVKQWYTNINNKELEDFMQCSSLEEMYETKYNSKINITKYNNINI
jgi:hypothetical protein